MTDRRPLWINPKAEAFAGSATRLRTLAPIANANFPLTAYRIAWLSRIARSKVYDELRRLLSAGLVEERKDRREEATWTLTDPAVAEFLRKKVRIAWSEDVSRTAKGLRDRPPSAP